MRRCGQDGHHALRPAPSHRRRAAGTDQRRSPAVIRPCWSRRRAPARPRACRWCWRKKPGQRARKFSCSNPGALPRAQRPRGWRTRSRSRSARRSAIASALVQRSRATRASKSSPKASSRISFSMIPRLKALRPFCSTNFTSARSMRTSVLRWRVTHSRACVKI